MSLYAEMLANSRVPQNTELFNIDIAGKGTVTTGSNMKSQTIGRSL